MSQGDVVVSAGKAITRAVCIGATPFHRDLAKSPGGLRLQESLWLPRQGCV